MRQCLACVYLALCLLLLSVLAVWDVYSWRTGAHLYRNVGVSLPPGFYLCLPVPAEGLLPLGAIVEVVPPPAVWEPVVLSVTAEMAPLHWLKQIRAAPGETVCLVGETVLVNGDVIAGRPLYADYPLPDVEGCWTLGHEDVFVMGSHPRSVDARYTGPWARTTVKGVCEALWTWEEE